VSDPLYYTFTLPPSAGGGDIVLEELSAGRVHKLIVQTTRAGLAGGAKDEAEREAAAVEASFDVRRELARASLYGFRGEQLGDGKAKDRVWRTLRNKEMNFILEAFDAVHDISEAERVGFRGTMEVSPRPPMLAGGSDESTPSSR